MGRKWVGKSGYEWHAQNRGVRGGGIYDYLHLAAARKAKAGRIYTLNLSNFRALYRPGDPEIAHPRAISG